MNTRTKLHERLAVFIAEDDRNQFHKYLVQLWNFIQGSSICKSLIEQLRAGNPSANDEAMKILKNRKPFIFEHEAMEAAVGSHIVEECARSTEKISESSIGILYTAVSGNLNRDLESFKQIFIDPLQRYLFEHIDDNDAFLYWMNRYKQRCEWFKRERLLTLAESDTQKSEYLLREDLLLYLHDQGVEFYEEPGSVSGRADLLFPTTDGNRITVEAKIFNPENSKGKSYIISGFHQAYRYAEDHQAEFGIIPIFKTGEIDLNFTLQKVSDTWTMHHGTRRIHLMVIDICQYDETASKRGPLKSETITQADLAQDTSQEGIGNDAPS